MAGSIMFNQILARLIEPIAINEQGALEWLAILDAISRECDAPAASVLIRWECCEVACHTLAWEQPAEEDALTSTWMWVESGCSVTVQARVSEALETEIFTAVKSAIRVASQLQCQIWKRQLIGKLATQLSIDCIAINSQGQVEGPLSEGWFDIGLFTRGSAQLQLRSEPLWLSETRKYLLRRRKEGDSMLLQSTSIAVAGTEDEFIQCILVLRPDDLVWDEKNALTLFLYPTLSPMSSIELSKWLGLSDSEASLAILFSKGMSAKDIVHKTGYSQHTVYTYIKRIYKKLGVSRQSQLTQKLLANMHEAGLDEYLTQNRE